MAEATKETTKTKQEELVVRARFIKTPPDKLRLVANAMRNKQLEDAITRLQFMPKYAAKPLSLVLKNALAQAKDRNLDLMNLYIKSVAVNEGPKLKRRRIVHRGRATSILKRMSHIQITLGQQAKPKSTK